MTQVEQNGAFRTRNEQQTALIAIIEVGDMVDPFKRMEAAKLHILEAEARGAAEQRRKDAEGQKPVAWCLVTSDQQIINGIHVEKCHAEDWKHRRASDTLTPLYTHPANVAVMEARIAELEEYYEAHEDQHETGVLNMTPKQYDRIARARAALTREGGV